MSCQETPRHQTSWRKLSQNREIGKSFLPQIFPAIWHAQLSCVYLVSTLDVTHDKRYQTLSLHSVGKSLGMRLHQDNLQTQVLNHTPGRLTGENFNSSSICYIQDLPECFLLTRYLQMRVGHDLQNKTH